MPGDRILRPFQREGKGKESLEILHFQAWRTLLMEPWKPTL
jgi:hypothetical protein